MLLCAAMQDENPYVNCTVADPNTGAAIPDYDKCTNADHKRQLFGVITTSTIPRPFCVDMSDDNSGNYSCQECRRECDCEMGYYCSHSSSSSNQCVKNDGKKYGERCDPAINPSTVREENSKDMFCGSIAYKVVNKQVRNQLEWAGVCVQGVCKPCFGDNYVQMNGYDPSCGGTRTCSKQAIVATDDLKWSSFSEDPLYVLAAVGTVGLVLLILLLVAVALFTAISMAKAFMPGYANVDPSTFKSKGGKKSKKKDYADIPDGEQEPLAGGATQEDPTVLEGGDNGDAYENGKSNLQVDALPPSQYGAVNES